MDVARPPRTGYGFEILIGALLLAVLLLLGGMWWNARRKAIIPSNESRAFHVLTVLAILESEFRASDPDKNGVQDFWTGDVAGLLSALGPTGKSGVDDLELARADPARPDARPYFGYWFVPLDLDPGGKPYRPAGKTLHPSAYGYCAYPARYEGTGRRTFLVNELNTVVEGYTDGAAPRAFPNDAELKRAWTFGNRRDR